MKDKWRREENVTGSRRNDEDREEEEDKRRKTIKKGTTHRENKRNFKNGEGRQIRGKRK